MPPHGECHRGSLPACGCRRRQSLHRSRGAGSAHIAGTGEASDFPPAGKSPVSKVPRIRPDEEYWHTTA